MAADKLLNYINSIGIGNIVWATDLDGTILSFQDDPEAVKPGLGLCESLQIINTVTQGRLYVVTGRDIAFVDRIFHPFQPNISAEHHCHVRGLGRNDAKKPDWSIIEADLSAVAQLHSSAWVESVKPFSRTIHFRNVDADAKDDVRLALTQLAVQATQTYNDTIGGEILGIKFGADAIEISLKNKNKGMAIDDIMSLPTNSGKIPLFWGDSEADVPAAERVKAYGGAAVAVGPDAKMKNIADFHFTDPEAANEALSQISTQLYNKNFIRSAVFDTSLRSAIPN